MAAKSGAHVQVLLEGFDELQRYIAQLPTALNAKARAVVEQAANDTARELVAVYPVGPRRRLPGGGYREGGTLRAGVKSKVVYGRFSVHGEVRSTAPHAHLWEFG